MGKSKREYNVCIAGSVLRYGDVFSTLGLYGVEMRLQEGIQARDRVELS